MAHEVVLISVPSARHQFLHCETTDTWPVHRAVCLFTSQLSLVLTVPIHDMTKCKYRVQMQIKNYYHLVTYMQHDISLTRVVTKRYLFHTNGSYNRRTFHKKGLKLAENVFSIDHIRRYRRNSRESLMHC